MRSPAVVVCDDHRVFAESLAVVLRAHGLTVVAITSSPAEAARAVVRHDADLCVMDLHFPRLEQDGLDGVRLIHQTRPGTSVVLLTGADGADVVLEAADAGVGGFARKDAAIGEILDVVFRVLDGQTALPLPAGGSPPRESDQAEGARLPHHLTPRERDVLAALVGGASTLRIADRLGVSASMARTHVQNVLVKLGVHSRLEAVAYAAAHGVLDGAALPRPAAGRGPVATAVTARSRGQRGSTG